VDAFGDGGPIGAGYNCVALFEKLITLPAKLCKPLIMRSGGIASLDGIASLQARSPDTIEVQRGGQRGPRAASIEQSAENAREHGRSPRLAQCDADSLVDVVSTRPFETRAIRARRVTARIDPMFAALVVAMLVVFAACFAIGRATDPNGPDGAESPTLQAASRSAARPIRLSGMPAIAIPAVAKVAPQPTLAREIFHAPLRAAPLRPSPLAPVPDPVVAPSPAKAPVQPTSGSAGSERSRSRPSSGEGGSFDSSG
jgi:hypothetical protein